MKTSRRALFPPAALALLAACGHPMTPSVTDPMDGGADAGEVTPDDMAGPSQPYTTPFPPTLPQLTPGSGVVLAAPRIIPIFFPKEGMQTDLVTFAQNYVGRSTSWQVLKDYGVGTGSVAPAVNLSQSPAASTTDTDLQALLSARIADGTLPRPDANSLYLLYTPATTTVTIGATTSCRDFAGYHNSSRLTDGTKLAYAVVPRCNQNSLAALTFATSHELSEAATDPFLDAWGYLGQPYALWLAALNGSEVGDLCENLSDPAYTEAGVGTVSRLWSNTAASQLRNPCQPAPAGVPFFSVPILTELRAVQLNGVIRRIESVAVAAGQSQTIEVRLLAGGAPSPRWTVLAEEVPLPGGAPTLTLSFAEAPGQARATGQDGTSLHLQIKAAATAAVGYTQIRLTSTGPTASGGQTQTQWVAAVRLLR